MNLSNINRFYLLSAGFNAARMGIGATSVIYMLSLGISLGDVAIIKIVQAIVIIFAEVPTGLIADTFGRRASVIAACLASLCSFAAFTLCNTVLGFSVAEIFNGLCIALWSGAFEALVIEKTDATKKPGNFVEFLFARMGSINAFATMIGGLVGGYLGDFSLLYPFYLAAGLMTMVTVYTCLYIPADKHTVSWVSEKKTSIINRFKKIASQINTHHRNAWKFSFSKPEIRDFFIIQIIIQFSIQPVLHYWQPYFHGLSSLVTTQLLGWIFFAYVGGQFVFSGLASKLLKNNNISPQNINLITSVIALTGFFVLCFFTNLYLTILYFIILQSAMGILRNNIGANFNRVIEDADRATILSTVSFVSRIGMLLNLAILKFTTGLYPISWIYLTSIMGMFALIPLVISWNRFFTEVKHA